MLRIVHAAVIAASILTLAATAAGQERDAAGAEKLYDDGSKLLAAGNWPLACASFEKSFALDPAPGTLLNLAGCAEHDGKIALAWSRFKDARSLNKDTKSDKQRQEVEAFIAASVARLEPRIPYLTVEVRGPTAGVVVTRGGQPSAVDTELPIDPGPHVVEASAPGYRTARREVTMKEGAHERVELVLEPAPAGTSAPADAPTTGPVERAKPPPASPPRSPAVDGGGGLGALRITGLVLGSVGVAAFGVTIGTGVAALGKQTDLDDLGCVTNDAGGIGCPAASVTKGQELSDAGSTLAIASTVTTFAGGALLGTGVLLFVLGGDDAPSPGEVAWLPIVGHGVAGITLSGSY